MRPASPLFVGFFPKVTQPAGERLQNGIVREICSVSQCISAGPEGWIHLWKHNDLGFYDMEDSARQAIAADGGQFDLYAYRAYPFRCLRGEIEMIELPALKIGIPRDYEFLGFDIVTRSTSDFFECSPLSCNYAANEYPVNAYCLISGFDQALETLQSICEKGSYEPGPYYLFEVFRKKDFRDGRQRDRQERVQPDRG